MMETDIRHFGMNDIEMQENAKTANKEEHYATNEWKETCSNDRNQ